MQHCIIQFWNCVTFPRKLNDHLLEINLGKCFIALFCCEPKGIWVKSWISVHWHIFDTQSLCSFDATDEIPKGGLNGLLYDCCISCNNLIILLTIEQFQIYLKVYTAQAREWGYWGQWKISSSAHVSKHFLKKITRKLSSRQQKEILVWSSALVNQSINQSNRTFSMD